MSNVIRNFSNCSNIGKLTLLIGLLVAVPLIILPFYPQNKSYALSFIIPSLCSVAIGAIACLVGRKDDSKFEWRSSMQRGSLTVLFAWGWGVLIGALPFVMSGQLTFVQALFEAVSGWTTTGLSVMDVSVIGIVSLAASRTAELSALADKYFFGKLFGDHFVRIKKPVGTNGR